MLWMSGHFSYALCKSRSSRPSFYFKLCLCQGGTPLSLRGQHSILVVKLLVFARQYVVRRAYGHHITNHELLHWRGIKSITSKLFAASIALRGPLRTVSLSCCLFRVYRSILFCNFLGVLLQQERTSRSERANMDLLLFFLLLFRFFIMALPVCSTCNRLVE